MTTNSIVRKNLLFLAGTPVPVSWVCDAWITWTLFSGGSPCGPISAVSVVKVLLLFEQSTRISILRVSLTLCCQFKDLHLLPLDKGNTADLEQHGEAALRMVWHYHAVLNVGGCSERPPPPQVEISVWWAHSVKIQHTSTYKRSATLIQLKIPKQKIKGNSCTFPFKLHHLAVLSYVS